MYLWDTHMVGHYANQHPTLKFHIERIEWHEIGLPTPAIAEVLRGRAEFALKATPEQVIWAHDQLWQTYVLITKFKVLLFEEEAKDEFKRLLKKFKSKKRYADMMIAAMALAGGHVVVTRNTKHFEDLLPPHQLTNWIDEPPR
ncbi:type II toxin-antitoxin system VapC family toxin [candidate division KSB1 bacterium]|nr:type II toxin-antitoxin system VapC family toxin [candidate division KSB1 bacterium]